MDKRSSFEKARDRIISTMAEKYDLSGFELSLVDEVFTDSYYAGKADGLIIGVEKGVDKAVDRAKEIIGETSSEHRGEGDGK